MDHLQGVLKSHQRHCQMMVNADERKIIQDNLDSNYLKSLKNNICQRVAAVVVTLDMLVIGKLAQNGEKNKQVLGSMNDLKPFINNLKSDTDLLFNFVKQTYDILIKSISLNKKSNKQFSSTEDVSFESDGHQNDISSKFSESSPSSISEKYDLTLPKYLNEIIFEDGTTEIYEPLSKLDLNSSQASQNILPDSPRKPASNKKILLASKSALIEHACEGHSAEAAEIWIYTYRSFMTASDCINALLLRLGQQKYTSNKRTRTASLLIRVVADLSPYELQNQENLMDLLVSVVHSLTSEGDATLASKLRKVFMKEVKSLIVFPIGEVNVLNDRTKHREEFRDNILKNPGKILELDPETLGKELTMIQQDLFSRIEIGELLARSKDANDTNKFPRFVEFVDHFNQVSYRLRGLILLQENKKKRIKVYHIIVEMCNYLKTIGNFNGMYCVHSALQSPAMRQLGPWPKNLEEKLSDVDILMSPNMNYKNYRTIVSQWNGAYIPWFGVITQQLISISEIGNKQKRKLCDKNDARELINFKMLNQQFEAIKPWKYAARQSYSFKRNDVANILFNQFRPLEGENVKFSDDYFWDLAVNILKKESK